MNIPQRYDPREAEARWRNQWDSAHLYAFDPADPRPIRSIDTPPPTVSGDLHIGHVYSYIQAETMVRFWRMRGYNVFYPFGFDDNGLPTERYVERSRGIRARDIGREAFIEACLETTEQVEARFIDFWQRLGISSDWSLRYSTIDARSRRTSQWSFLELYRKGRIYRTQAPNPWCIECQTAIAQAEIDDAERSTIFYTLQFSIGTNSATLPIATTRPELLPACVAVFVHPDDARYAYLIGQTAITPLFGQQVPILADPLVDPAKGSGAVMCCTFGDTTDVAWWRAHNLPLIPLITREGLLSDHGAAYAGLTLAQARKRIIADLRAADQLIGEQTTGQTVRVHERCGTPLEILETSQWFVRLLDLKDQLIAAGREISWQPAYMRSRYEHWVENLGWDWCISRQRFYGVPFPLWHCDACGEVILADETQLPLDPATAAPPRACACGNSQLRPETDVMDTWATSSTSPQICGQLPDNPELFKRVFPMELRPQAHDIIRTWAFYTIVKSHLHHGQIPWRSILMSGHGLDPQGLKLSKSKGNARTSPEQLIERYGADAVRYWAAGGSPGADQLLDEDTMKRGGKLVTKLWNASRFIASQGERPTQPATLRPLDRAMLSWLQRLVQRATACLEAYDYAAALDATERFFWATLCDNYLELAKGRLYDGVEQERTAALATLHIILDTLLRLFAPFLPFVTEEIWSHYGHDQSLHTSAWPESDETLIDGDAEQAGTAIFEIVAQIRRFKSERKLSLGAPLARIDLAVPAALGAALAASEADLRSASRAHMIGFSESETLAVVPALME